MEESKAVQQQQQQQQQGAAAAAAAAASPPTSTEKEQLTPAEKQARKLKLVRFGIYLGSLTDKYHDVFTSNQFMGLHANLGDKEIGRLQDAMRRHGREDQFDNINIPVDVLLRTLTFMPNRFDPRLTKLTTPVEQSMAAKTLERMCCVNSTLLFTIAENRNLLGGKKPNEKDVAKSQAARMEWRKQGNRMQAVEINMRPLADAVSLADGLLAGVRRREVLAQVMKGAGASAGIFTQVMSTLSEL